jgi:inosine/xanthosine triphosphatase
VDVAPAPSEVSCDKERKTSLASIKYIMPVRVSSQESVRTMRIVVGSTNPVKVHAAVKAFSAYFADVEVVGVQADSEVADQPYNEAIKRGAENRANNALKEVHAEFGVGLEGGVLELYGTAYLAGYCAIMNTQRECHGSWGYLWELPPRILRELATSGKELGTVMDERTHRENTKQTEGAIGIFSKGVLHRELAFHHTVIGALIPFINKEAYKDV